MKAILDRIGAVAPSTPVLMGEVGTLTYGALREASGDLAKQVNSVAPLGRPVAICLDNGPDFLIGLVGVWASGRTPLVVDHRLPAPDFQNLTAAAGAACAIAAGGLSPLKTLTSSTRSTSTVWDEALLMHSSGTTGAPKLLARTALALQRDIGGIAAVNDLCPGDTVLCPIAWSHGGGLESGVIMSLWAGATIVAPRLAAAGALVRVLRDFDIDHFYTTPFIVRQLLRRQAPKVFHVPRTCVSLGAPLLKDDAERLESEYGILVSQSYGSSEFGGISWGRPGEDPASVGRPLQGVEVNSGSVDRPSEVLVRTKGTNDPWFRTGDLGFLDSGLLYVMSRLDDVVNIAGMKVLPSYVESVLREHEDVQDALVCHLEGVDGGTVIGAMVVEMTGSGLSVTDLQRWCEERLPQYSVPTLFSVTAELPMTNNGKPSRMIAARVLAETINDAPAARRARALARAITPNGSHEGRQYVDSCQESNPAGVQGHPPRHHEILVDVDSEGIDLRNLSCFQMGIRELLHCEGATEVAQALARPVGLCVEKKGDGYWRLATGFSPAEPFRGFELNRGWRFVAHIEPLASGVASIVSQLSEGHPVLACPGEFHLSYFPSGANPLHVAVFARIEDDDLVVYDDMPLPWLVHKMARVPLGELRGRSGDAVVHWFCLESEAPSLSWPEELGRILTLSVDAWRKPRDPDYGFGGLSRFCRWFRGWDLDVANPADVDRLTELFLSMRFEMSSAHHLLEVALRRTPWLESGQRAADTLQAAWKKWNEVIFMLVAWKEKIRVVQRPRVYGLLDDLSDLEERAIGDLERCLSGLKTVPTLTSDVWT